MCDLGITVHIHILFETELNLSSVTKRNVQVVFSGVQFILTCSMFATVLGHAVRDTSAWDG